jgi:hypothetical protein
MTRRASSATVDAVPHTLPNAEHVTQRPQKFRRTWCALRFKSWCRHRADPTLRGQKYVGLSRPSAIPAASRSCTVTGRPGCGVPVPQATNAQVSPSRSNSRRITPGRPSFVPASMRTTTPTRITRLPDLRRRRRRHPRRSPHGRPEAEAHAPRRRPEVHHGGSVPPRGSGRGSWAIRWACLVGRPRRRFRRGESPRCSSCAHQIGARTLYAHDGHGQGARVGSQVSARNGSPWGRSPRPDA